MFRNLTYCKCKLCQSVSVFSLGLLKLATKCSLHLLHLGKAVVTRSEKDAEEEITQKNGCELGKQNGMEEETILIDDSLGTW